jgi:plastocyanin
MRLISRHVISLGIAATAAIIAGCDDADVVNFIPNNDVNVSIQDQCDSATFNAALGAGTCHRNGSVTFAQFNAELAATHRVALWQFVPSLFNVRIGQSIHALNQGGELHTFTEVENFGGGIVPALNTASGNPIPAPECLALTPADQIQPGAGFNTDAATTVGTEHYQCCIHPWMRATVTVTP